MVCIVELTTNLAPNVEVRVILQRALKHATIVLDEVEVDSGLSSSVFRVLDQRLLIL